MAECLDELEQMAQTALILGDNYEPSANAVQQEVGQSDQAAVYLQAPTSYKPTNMYLVRLEGSLDSPAKVQELGQMSRLPEYVEDEAGTNTGFCIVNGSARSRIEHSLPSTACRPTFILINKAFKELDEHSWGPYLGKDCTLPQNRISDVSPHPKMAQFPVWYFFYGTLADPEQLQKLINRADSRYELIPAKVTGGEIKIWAGKYKAMVDNSNAVTSGFAFQVLDQEEEDCLRVYETNAYEVVRCMISMAHARVHGLTFRYVGSAEMLS